MPGKQHAGHPLICPNGRRTVWRVGTPVGYPFAKGAVA